MPLTFKVDPADPRPIYEQLVVHIVFLYDNEVIRPGDRLPPEREWAAKLNISRGTVKKAIEILKHQGYLESFQGSGNYITSPEHAGISSGIAHRITEICDRCLMELQELNLPNHQIFSMIHDYLVEAEQKFAQVSLAIVGCSPENLIGYKRQLNSLSHLDVQTFVLEDLSHSPSLLSQASACDLIFTPAEHFDQLKELMPHCVGRIYSFAAATSAHTMVQIATLPADTKVAVLCLSLRYFQLIRETLEETVYLNRSPICLMKDSEPALPKNIPEDIDVLILRDQSPLLVNPAHAQTLNEFLARGGRILQFSHEMDHGSIMLIENALRQVWRQKFKPEPALQAI